LVFLLPATAVVLGVSALTPLQARRLGSGVFAIAIVLAIAALAFAPEINGAKRWLPLGPIAFQPSELLKPGFVIAAAWMLAEGARNPRFPGIAIGMGLYLFCAALLVMQPDYGQAALLTAVWMTMFFIAGGSVLWIAVLAVIAIAGVAGGYQWSPHIARRIDAFINPQAGDNYQIDKAMEAIANGGAFGRAAEGASVKLSLPDAHTDFIFAVAAEEFGMWLCLIVLALFAVFVARAYARASETRSLFAQCAICGLAAMIGLQSFINIGVNLRMLPAKGMTLPFISYGGSSLIATGLSVGLILALTRRQFHTGRRKDVMP
jgi:cell division protein FtsW